MIGTGPTRILMCQTSQIIVRVVENNASLDSNGFEGYIGCH